MAYKFNPFTGNFDITTDPPAAVTVTTATHNAATNTVVLCNRAGAVAVTLPAPTANAQIVVKDISGAAETNTITVTSASGNVDGSASQTITSNYGSLAFIGDGTNWWTL